MHMKAISGATVVETIKLSRMRPEAAYLQLRGHS